ncbi:MAG: hypothetical protein HWE24_20090 [Oceanospirillaceae bacterium]|nr:hypothetical protein [Oceanospirillaceae bacterium]
MKKKPLLILLTFTGALSSASALEVSGPSSSSTGHYSISWEREVGGSELSYDLRERKNNGSWSTQRFSHSFSSKNFSKSSGGRYDYQVRACIQPDGNPNRTCFAWGNTHRVDVQLPAVAPTSPHFQSIDNPEGDFTFDWDSPSGTVKRYEVKQIDLTYGGLFNQQHNVTNSELAVSNVMSAEWGFKVRACNDFMCGPYSSQINITINRRPRAVQNFEAVVEGRNVTFNWTAADVDNQKTHFLLRRYQVGKEANYETVLTIPENENSVTLTNHRGGRYSYRLQACFNIYCSFFDNGGFRIVEVEKPTTAVVLGDSFSSGEGGRWKGNALLPNNPENRSHGFAGTDVAPAILDQAYEADSVDNGCHRAHSAPIHGLREDFDETVNLACSGAKNKAVWSSEYDGVTYRGEPPQLEQLKELSLTNEIELITIGVGGNDMGFSSLIEACASAYVARVLNIPTKPHDCRAAVRERVESLQGVEVKLKKTIQSTRSTMSELGKIEGVDYKILLLGYPSIVASDPDSHRGTGLVQQCPFNLDDLAYIDHSLMGPLNGLYASTAEQEDVNFVAIKEVFNGHKLCDSRPIRGHDNEPHTDMYDYSSEWVRFIDYPLDLHNPLSLGPYIEQFVLASTSNEIMPGGYQGRIQESMHPNQFGQQAVGKCLADVWDDLSLAAESRSYSCFTPRGLYQSGLSDIVVEERERARTIQIPGVTVEPNSTTLIPFELSSNDFENHDGINALNSAFFDVNVSQLHPRTSDVHITLISPTGQRRSIHFYEPPGENAPEPGENDPIDPIEGNPQPFSIQEPPLPYDGNTKTVYLIGESYNYGQYFIEVRNDNISSTLNIRDIYMTVN